MNESADLSALRDVPVYDLRTGDYSVNDRELERLQGKLRNTYGVALSEDFGASDLDYELRPYYGNDPYELHGYAVLVDGAAPIDGSSATSHLLGAYTGTATSRWRIRSDLSNDELEKRWRKAHDDRSLPTINPLLTQQTFGAYTEHDPNAVRDPRYLIVHGNDTPAALALIQSVQEKPTTVGALVKSQQYRDLIISSAHVRAQTANATAKALDVEIDEEPDLTTLTHHIVPADALAHKNGRAGNGVQDQYVVHNNTIDTSTSHQGVLVSQGPMGGYAYLSRTKPVSLANGTQSRAWRTDEMSVLGANAPRWSNDNKHIAESALHRNANGESRETFDGKVHWSGTLSTTHPRADERRTLVTQNVVHQVAKPSDAGVDIRVVPHKMIAVQLADHEPRVAQTLAELSALAKQTKAAALPVPLNSEAIRDLTRYFDKLPQELVKQEQLSDVMNNSVRVPVNELHILRSACKATGPDHYHYWYDHVYRYDKDRDPLLDEYDEDQAGDVDEANDFVEDMGPIKNYARPVTERIAESMPSTSGHRTHERIKNAKDAPPAPMQTRVMLGTNLIDALSAIKAADEKKATKSGKK
jgi:hypothetical protein